MIKFFRKIRQKLLEQSKIRSYFVYAFGELILVVIGILIALQINNWNQNRIEKNTLHLYYHKMTFAFSEQIKEQKMETIIIEDAIQKLKKAAEIIENKKLESLDSLKLLLEPLAIAWVHDFSLPIFEEFIEKGYLSSVDDEALKIKFENLKKQLLKAKSMDNLKDNDYITNTAPFLIENVKLYDILSSQRKDILNFKGGTTLDYSSTFDNIKFWNILTYKCSFLANDLTDKERIIKTLQEIIVSL